MWKRRRKSKKTHNPRSFGFPFLVSIFGNILLGGIGIVSVWGLVEQGRVNTASCIVSGTGFLIAVFILCSFKVSKWRVIIHELKHAVVVRLSGNKLKDFHIDTHTGHVKYVLYSNRVHFAPLITLAPYFFPLFSLPAFIICIILEPYSEIPLYLLMGFTLGLDMVTGISEIHPHQTDFRQVPGGIIFSLLYLAGAHIAWTGLCLVWILAGREGYLFSGYLLITLIQLAAKRIEV